MIGSLWSTTCPFAPLHHVPMLTDSESLGSDRKAPCRRLTQSGHCCRHKQSGTFPKGITGHVIDKIGYHGFLTWHLELDGVRVPEGDRLTGLYGDEGADADLGGFAAVQRGLNIARVHTAARAVGVARGALEDTWAYLQERVQFGRPIAEFQALRFALADMAAEVAQARAFWQQVAHLLDQGETAESESAQVKLLATEMAVRVTNQAMQLHGGNGYTTERRIERYWRDAS